MRRQTTPDAVKTFDRASPDQDGSTGGHGRQIGLGISPKNSVVNSRAADAQHELAERIVHILDRLYPLATGPATPSRQIAHTGADHDETFLLDKNLTRTIDAVDLPDRLPIHGMDVVEGEAFPIIKRGNQQRGATSYRFNPEFQTGRCGQIPAPNQQRAEEQP